MDSAEELKIQANSLFTKGRYGDAVQIYKKCLEVSGISNDLRGIIFRNMAQCYLKLGNYKKTIEAANSALTLSSDDTKALYRRCLAYEKCGKLKEAIKDMQKLVKIDSTNKAVNELAFRLQACIASLRDEQNSLDGKINSMFEIIQDGTSPEALITQALNNLISLAVEDRSAAIERIWSHSAISKIFALCHHTIVDVVFLTHKLLAVLIEHNADYGLQLLTTLKPQYFIGRIFSVNEDISADMCNLLRRLLESLTQVKSYLRKRDEAFRAHNKDKSKPHSLISKQVFPPYKLDQKIQKPVEEILHHVIKAINSYKLEAAPRDRLIELLTWFIPEETGINWAKYFFAVEDAIERVLDVAAAASASLITRRNNKSSEGDKSAAVDTTVPAPNMHRCGILKTTSKTRLLVACLLSRVYEDLISDKLMQAFNKQCADFVLDLLTDKFIESKVKAAAVIGTLFSGPFDVGSFVLSREGILKGLILLTQCENLAYQTVALDTIILATNKKDKCMAIIDQAVPILRELYKSSDDGIKVRALVGLCKLGVLGGRDASSQSLAEGSNVVLMKACRRLLLSQQRAKTGDTAVETSDPVDFTRVGPMNRETSTRWAIDGLAFLSLSGEVKDAIATDTQLLHSVFNVAQMGILDTAFPLASLLANLTNSFEEKEVTPEMLELAKFSKQHIPQKHAADEPAAVTDRRRVMIDAGLPTCLYHLTIDLASGTVAAQPGIRELVSRIYLSSAELVDRRGLLVSAGAGKALLNLALDKNTDAGQLAASQALAKLTITSDPRITFTGQRSLEVIRPILQLLDNECSALQNFEGLLALTNLASLDENHRTRILMENGLPTIENLMFEDHQQIRRAATECFANLAQHHAVTVSCGGVLPLEEHCSLGKSLVTRSNSERIKLLMMFCLDEEDIFLARAAAGALATMSYDEGIVKQIVKVSKWVEVLQALVANPAPAIQHRGIVIIMNLIANSERSLAEHIANSSMLEVLMAVTQLPDISADSTLPPACIVLAQGRPMSLTKNEAISDREKTKSIATAALDKLVEYKLIQPASRG